MSSFSGAGVILERERGVCPHFQGLVLYYIERGVCPPFQGLVLYFILGIINIY